jgi:thioredoxin 1
MHHPLNDGEFQFILAGASGKLVCIDFFATWCGPCKAIAPEFERLSTMYTTEVFVKVDGDRCRETCRTYGVRAYPTLMVWKDGKIIEKWEGGKVTRRYLAI